MGRCSQNKFELLLYKERKIQTRKNYFRVVHKFYSCSIVQHLQSILFRPWCYAPSIILCNSQQSASKGWGKYNIYQYLLFLCIIGETLNAFLTTTILQCTVGYNAKKVQFWKAILFAFTLQDPSGCFIWKKFKKCWGNHATTYYAFSCTQIIYSTISLFSPLCTVCLLTEEKTR